MSSTTPSTLAHTLPAAQFESKLSEQLSWQTEKGESRTKRESSDNSTREASMRPATKSRSLSDNSRPASSPLPTHRDPVRPSAKDDNAPSIPATPQRPSGLQQGLSLNMPSRVSGQSPVANRAPLSPKLDSSHIYGSPGSVLPRRSRGLDFSRACTNLHHSTLAESSPDSSPTVGGRGVTIPQRRGSQGSTSMHQWSSWGPADRTGISSSVSSVNMMESDTSSSEEDDEPMGGDRDEMMITTTPQANKVGGPSPYAAGNVMSPGNDWMGGYSHAAASLMSFQRARFRKGRSRHSSSSASGHSSKPSPGPISPPAMKSVENQGGGYFGAKNITPRRQSLSLGTRDLRLSDLSDDGEGRASRTHSPAAPASSEGGPFGVIRRAVTRRGSLLVSDDDSGFWTFLILLQPKTKTFARIRAALMEEGAPINSEAKREAEVIRQVRESEPSVPHKSPTLSDFASLHRSSHEEGPLDAEDHGEKSGDPIPTESSFSRQANRNSGGPEFWNSFDERYRTPPPSLRQTAASSMSEDDSAMDMTPSTAFGSTTEFAKPLERNSRASTPVAASHISSLGDFRRKRRREDDLDSNLFKRRAVSPSTSIQSSPVMPNSPVVKDPKAEAVNRNTSHAGTPRRVGLQGMNETSDGFMNMSIE